jgi:diadenosine tetraphosphate (Ap4A) HIT family hydrolase
MISDCIFCKIVKGEIPCVKVWEDENYLAFLDIMPNTEGMTLVIPKKHFDSYVFEMADRDYSDLFLVTKKVAKYIEKGLKVQRVALVMEGLGVNHAHMKLYPLHGLKEKFVEMWAPDKIWSDKYKGYISTQTGEKRTIEELQTVANKIKENLK